MTSPITTPNIQRKIQNLKLNSTVTFSIQEAKKSIDDNEKNKPHLKSPYYEEYNFYSRVDKMGFSVETAVTSLEKRMNNWHHLWVSNFEQYQEYSPQQYIEKLKKYIDAYKNYPEIDYSVSIAKTRNILVYYLNMHSDPDNPVTLSEETIEDIETTLDASVAKIEQQGTKRSQFPTDDSTESPLNKKICWIM